MSLHRASGHWQLGLALSLVTALCWATLPIALKIVLEALDPITLTWFRFVVAAAVTAIWLAARGRLADYRVLGRRGGAMLAAAALMLVGNYVLYLLGVQYTTPANAQLLISQGVARAYTGRAWTPRRTCRRWCRARLTPKAGRSPSSAAAAMSSAPPA